MDNKTLPKSFLSTASFIFSIFPAIFIFVHRILFPSVPDSEATSYAYIIFVFFSAIMAIISGVIFRKKYKSGLVRKNSLATIGIVIGSVEIIIFILIPLMMIGG